MKVEAAIRHFLAFGHTVSSRFPFQYLSRSTDKQRDLTFESCVGDFPAEPLPVDSPLLTSTRKTRNGKPFATVWREGQALRFTFAEQASFLISSQEISCRTAREGLEWFVELQFLSPVFSLWLELRGIPAIHASAVLVRDRAVAFLGGSRSGKSCLAASFIQHGSLLLTDDVLAVCRRDDGFRALPSFPQLRLWPEAGSLLAEPFRDAPRVHPAAAKRRVRTESFAADGGLKKDFPLARIYIPERVPARSEVAILSVKPLEALRELIRMSFSPRLVEALGLQAARLDLLSRLAVEVPVRRLLIPEGLEKLPLVCEAVEADLD